jgi:PAS domain S-box-containing protein
MRRFLWNITTSTARWLRDLRHDEHYRELVERAGDIIYETDGNGYFTYVNPVAANIIGAPIEELVGIRFTRLIREDKRRAAEKFYLAQAMEKTPSTYYEFPIITRQNKEVWIGQNVQLLTFGGVITGFQAVARDITERVQTDRFKDELLAIVSHELRTPLTAIRGALGLMRTGKLPPEQFDRMATVAVENCDRMTRLLNDFLDLERLRLGGVEMVIAPVDLRELFAKAISTVQQMADANGNPISVRVEAERLNGDHDRLLQAIVNLLTNAIKFSANGSPIELSSGLLDNATTITVCDHGRGIPADKLDHIFESFRQVDQADNREKGGIGIGLAITKFIVEAHRGEISVKSVVGEGTTFTIYLPA